jgi:hypothetical protein
VEQAKEKFAFQADKVTPSDYDDPYTRKIKKTWFDELQKPIDISVEEI